MIRGVKNATVFTTEIKGTVSQKLKLKNYSKNKITDAVFVEKIFL